MVRVCAFPGVLMIVDRYDEDQEDSGEEEEGAWETGRVVRSDSDEDSVRGAIGVIDEEEDDEDEDDDEADDDILEMRSTRSTASSTRTLRAARPPMATKKAPWSSDGRKPCGAILNTP